MPESAAGRHGSVAKDTKHPSSGEKTRRQQLSFREEAGYLDSQKAFAGSTQASAAGDFRGRPFERSKRPARAAVPQIYFADSVRLNQRSLGDRVAKGRSPCQFAAIVPPCRMFKGQMKCLQAGDLKIGRATDPWLRLKSTGWGNPIRVHQCGNRTETLQKRRTLDAGITQLARDSVCSNWKKAPPLHLECHDDILVRLWFEHWRSRRNDAEADPGSSTQ